MHVLGYRCFLICFSLVYIGSQLKWFFSICKLIFHHCFLFLALPGLKVRSFFWICSSCSVFLFGLRCEKWVASFPAFLSTAPLPMLSIYVAVSPKVFFQFILWSLCSLFLETALFKSLAQLARLTLCALLALLIAFLAAPIALLIFGALVALLILIAFLATLTCSLPPHVCHISRPSLLAPIRLFLRFLLVPPLPSLLFVFPDCLLLCTCWNMAFCSHSRSWTMPSHPFLSYVFPFLCNHCSHCLLVFPIPPVDVHFQILRRQSSNCW